MGLEEITECIFKCLFICELPIHCIAFVIVAADWWGVAP